MGPKKRLKNTSTFFKCFQEPTYVSLKTSMSQNLQTSRAHQCKMKRVKINFLSHEWFFTSEILIHFEELERTTEGKRSKERLLWSSLCSAWNTKYDALFHRLQAPSHHPAGAIALAVGASPTSKQNHDNWRAAKLTCNCIQGFQLMPRVSDPTVELEQAACQSWWGRPNVGCHANLSNPLQLVPQY